MKDIDQLLEDWQVQQLDYEDMLFNNGKAVADYLKDWYIVVDIYGIVGYFAKETDALRFRLNEINRELNR